MGPLQLIVLTVGILGFGVCQEETCSYPGVCDETVVIDGVETTVSRPCIIDEPCTSFYDTWSSCSCTSNTRSRIGRCCGPLCTKVVTQTEDCTPGPCPSVDGMWASWMTWTETTPCSASCCGGVQNRTRTRTCTDPPPSGDGAFCEGDSTENEINRACNTQDCPAECTGNDFEPDTCERCTTNYFRCDNLVPVEQLCADPNVWSVEVSACVPLQICLNLVQQK